MSSTPATEAFQGSSGSNAYGSDQIQISKFIKVLEGLDPVIKRPGMYIGSTGPRGLHHLVYEKLDNAVDEAHAGFASKIEVVLLADGSVSVADNGRGIPTDMHPATKKSALETVLMLMITLGQEDTDPEKNHHNEYFYAGGLVEYVRWLNTDNCSDAASDTMLGYANTIRTVDGGAHIHGTKASLTRTLNSLGKKSKIIKIDTYMVDDTMKEKDMEKLIKPAIS
ncbi:hypothetical protein ACE6H2_023219 [Prunus campanulata]